MTLQLVPCVLTSDLLDLDLAETEQRLARLAMLYENRRSLFTAQTFHTMGSMGTMGSNSMQFPYEKPRISELVESGASGCLLPAEPLSPFVRLL